MNFKKHFNRISEIIEEHLMNDSEAEIIKIILKEFAAEQMCMAYAFDFITGHRLPQYIRRRKLCAAFRKVENEQCKWEDVLEIAGYSEQSSFDKAFKSAYGSSPAQYLKGNRKVCLTDLLKIDSIQCNFSDSTLKDNITAMAAESPADNHKGDYTKMNINVKKKEDVNKLNKYLTQSLQALYDLTLPQIMFAEMYCDDDVSIYMACSALEEEYKNLQPEDFDEFNRDCYFLTIHHRFSKEIAEKVVSDIRKNPMLDIHQTDIDYIQAIATSISMQDKGLAD